MANAWHTRFVCLLFYRTAPRSFGATGSLTPVHQLNKLLDAAHLARPHTSCAAAAAVLSRLSCASPPRRTTSAWCPTPREASAPFRLKFVHKMDTPEKSLALQQWIHLGSSYEKIQDIPGSVDVQSIDLSFLREKKIAW